VCRVSGSRAIFVYSLSLLVSLRSWVVVTRSRVTRLSYCSPRSQSLYTFLFLPKCSRLQTGMWCWRELESDRQQKAWLRNKLWRESQRFANEKIRVAFGSIAKMHRCSCHTAIATGAVCSPPSAPTEYPDCTKESFKDLVISPLDPSNLLVSYVSFDYPLIYIALFCF